MPNSGDASRRTAQIARAMLLTSSASLLFFAVGFIWLLLAHEDSPPPVKIYLAAAVLFAAAMLALSIWLLWLDGEPAAGRRGSELLSGAVRTSPDVILQLDEACRLVAINPAAETRFGHSSEAVSGMPVGFLLPELAVPKRAAEPPLPPPPPAAEPKPISFGEEPEPSARRLAMRTGTRLSHLVQPLLGYTEIAMVSLEPGHSVRADLQEIGRASSRVALLAQSLELFGGGRRLESETLELNAFLDRIEPDLRFVLQPLTQLRFDKAAHPVTVQADSGLTRLALLLLACNAEEAMPPSSSVTISVVDDGLRVADAGPGLSKQVRASLFRPLASTKDAERGVGLGLHAARAAMRLQHGELRLVQSGETGSVLALVYPRAATIEEATAEPAADALIGRK